MDFAKDKRYDGSRFYCPYLENKVLFQQKTALQPVTIIVYSGKETFPLLTNIYSFRSVSYTWGRGGHLQAQPK